MRYSFTGKNTTVSDALKEKITTKLERIGKLVPENASVVVTFSVVKLDHTVEVTVNLPKRILRAEVTGSDMYAAIDEVVDVLEKQMVKYKNRLRDKARRDTSFIDELKYFEPVGKEDKNDDEEVRIAKTKKFAVKPMDAEEAVMEMELLGHNFFVYRNASSDEINVVYKRKNGTYGLIEPEI
ncbi:MAG: ribosome-associated translation inhibitor RaiA [Clostridiales bacterium]|nr:ribosome-associated translation inhibitor RaiA [Clostridiales bacterium]